VFREFVPCPGPKDNWELDTESRAESSASEMRSLREGRHRAGSRKCKNHDCRKTVVERFINRAKDQSVFCSQATVRRLVGLRNDHRGCRMRRTIWSSVGSEKAEKVADSVRNRTSAANSDGKESHSLRGVATTLLSQISNRVDHQHIDLWCVYVHNTGLDLQ